MERAPQSVKARRVSSVLDQNEAVEEQLREVELFESDGWPIQAGVRLVWEEKCIICLRGAANFYAPGCGHVAMCSDCSVNAVIRKLQMCPICRKELEGKPMFRFARRTADWWKRGVE